MPDDRNGEEQRVEERRDGHFCSQHESNTQRIQLTATNADKSRTIAEVAAGRMSLMMWGLAVYVAASLTFMGTTSASINKIGKQVVMVVTATSINTKYYKTHEAAQDVLLADCSDRLDILERGLKP